MIQGRNTLGRERLSAPSQRFRPITRVRKGNESMRITETLKSIKSSISLEIPIGFAKLKFDFHGSEEDKKEILRELNSLRYKLLHFTSFRQAIYLDELLKLDCANEICEMYDDADPDSEKETLYKFDEDAVKEYLMDDDNYLESAYRDFRASLSARLLNRAIETYFEVIPFIVNSKYFIWLEKEDRDTLVDSFDVIVTRCEEASADQDRASLEQSEQDSIIDGLVALLKTVKEHSKKVS